MSSFDILCFNSFNLKNKVMKIEQKKIFRVPSKILKNISWPINICLKYFMAPTKTLRSPLLHTQCTVAYITSLVRHKVHVRHKVILMLDFEVYVVVLRLYQVLLIFQQLMIIKGASSALVPSYLCYENPNTYVTLNNKSCKAAPFFL